MNLFSIQRPARLALVAALALGGCSKAPARVLVFSRTAAFRHSSIPAGRIAIQNS